MLNSFQEDEEILSLPGNNTEDIANVEESVKLFRSKKLNNPSVISLLNVNIRSIQCNFEQFLVRAEELLKYVDVLTFSEASQGQLQNNSI